MGGTVARGAAVCLAMSAVITVTPLTPVTQSVGAASTDVVFNEILYHPEDDNPAGEFVELFNRGGSTVDLSGWCIDGVKYCFPGGSSIGPERYVVVTSASYSGKLSNGGEELMLLDASKNVIEAFEYDDKNDWPALADGEGASLQRLTVHSSAANSGNWRSDSPTPGAPNVVGSAPMPVWSKVTHNKLPAPGVPLTVTANVSGAAAASIQYQIGFGPIVTVSVPIVDGAISTTVPGQAAGTLIRYRLTAGSTDGVLGDWPRQGDGSWFTGTTVASVSDTDLPRFEWFMPDDQYAVAVADLTLHGDNGYPAVLAYGGEIFDNTKVRVKGQISRLQPKKKWKFILPAGHELEIDGLFPEKVDEFALHSNWSDKSFLRETIASEAFAAAGTPVSQAFPVQLERNGQFYGLYTYVEQQDSTWRERWGLDDASLYEVGGGDVFGLLTLRDAGLGEFAFRRKYEKETNEFENDDELRELIRVLNQTSGGLRRSWIFANIDVPSVVNTLAASAVFQNQDFGHKNYRLAHNQLGKWTVIPTDFDLTFGHRSSIACGATCDFVGVGGAFEHPGGPLFLPFWQDPILVELVRQRMRTITEEILAPAAFSERVAALRDVTADEALRDRAIWGTYGFQKKPADDANHIISRFIAPQATRLLGTMVNQGRVAPTSTPAAPRLNVSKVQYGTENGIAPHVMITNLEPTMVDISSYKIDALKYTVPGGVILRSGETAVVMHEDSGSVASIFGCCVLAGTFGEDLEDLRDGFLLTNRAGQTVAQWTQLPPGTMTEIAGTPNRSALVSLTSFRAAGSGFLEVIDCAATPGSTANVNSDGPAQARAGAAIVQFNADGKACIFNSTAAHVIADIQGYFSEAAIDDVADTRLLDTRSGTRPAAQSQTKFAGRPNSSAVVSVVAVDTSASGHLQALPCGATPGLFANITYDGISQTRSGLAVVRFDAAGEACVYTSEAANIVVDLQAYLNAGAVDEVDGVRLLDTRNGPRPTAGSLTMVTGRPNSTAVAAVFATNTTVGGFLQVVPCSVAPGGTANVVYDSPFQSLGSLAVVPFDASGLACVYTSAATDIVVDLQTYFAAGAFDDIADNRLVDTRVD